MALSVLIASAGWFFAQSLFRDLKRKLPDPAKYTGIPRLLFHKYFVDEIYMKFIVEPIKSLSTNIFLNISDKKIIDGAADGSASGWNKVAGVLSKFQTGNIQVYGFYMIFGFALAFVFLLFVF
jgi:NADH-quinone oxidoreductase subunit L